MPYIQLSTLPLPDAAGREKVFAFLHREPTEPVEPGDPPPPNRYRVALLVAEANAALGALLARIGFERDAATPLPSGFGLGAGWRFHRAGEASPFLPLTDDPDADAAARLSTYLEFAFADEAGDVLRPTALTVHQATLSAAQFHRGFEPTGFSFLAMQRSGVQPDGWSFRFAAADETTDVAPAWTLPIRVRRLPIHLQDKLDPPFVDRLALDLASEPAPTPLPPEAKWLGGQVTFRSGPVVGDADDRIPFDGGVLVARFDEGVVKLLLELQFTEHPSLSFGPAGLARVVLRNDAVAVRLDEQGAALHVYRDANGGGVTLTVDLEFPLIMARGALPDSLAFLVPLVSRSGGPTTLRHRFAFQIDRRWLDGDEPVFVLSRDVGAAWRWDDFINTASREGWPFGMLDVGRRSLTFGGLRWSLADLLGDAKGPVSAALAPAPIRPGPALKLDDGKLTITLGLTVTIASQPLILELDVQFDLLTGRLRENSFNLRLGLGQHGNEVQVIDLGVLAILIPSRPSGALRDGDKLASDGTIDLDKRTFVLRAGDPDACAPMIVVPGSLADDNIDNRLLLKLKAFSPDEWSAADPDRGGDKLFIRVGPNGLSFRALIETKHTPVIFRGPGKTIKVRPQSERGPIKSEIVLIDNVLRAATVFAEMDVPGVDDLIAKVELGLRQEQRGAPPVVVAAVDLDSTNGMPLAQFSVGYLQMVLEDFRARLTWDMRKGDWGLSVRVDGSISLSPRTSSAGGLEDLRKRNALVVRDLDLMALHKGPGEVSLQLEKPVEFDCLDGLFGVRLEQVRFGWGGQFFFACETAAFRFKQPGQLDVRVEVGGVRLEFGGGRSLKMRNPSKIGIDVRLGDSIRFRGAVAWVDNDRERYFAAAGTLNIEGLPEASALLKLGSGVKDNGKIVPNIVLYGSLDYETPLFAGVYAKNFGAGVGINNRLAGVGDRPNAETLLKNIDRIEPSRIEGWEFVRRNGFYLSIVGTTILAASPGGNSVVSAYVASLVISLDIDLNVVAGGKLWFSSSVDFVRRGDNWRRPALVGTIAMLPRERVISAALESRPNPAIEDNDQLARILNNGRIKLSFLMARRLVDFYLEEVSYRDEFLGVQMLYRGSFRMAVLDGVVFVLARQAVTGFFERKLEAGPGGFEGSGAVGLALELGGLISGRGVAAYASIDFSLALRLRAWITIEFSITIGCGRWKKRWKYSKTFRLPPANLELGLRGTLAFDESGRIGFDGSLSISVSICSFSLNISPSLRFNTDAVDRVRARVAAFERRIESVRQELLGGAPKIVAMHAAAAAEPTWLHYEVGGRRLLIPQADMLWLTPLVKAPSTSDPDSPPRFYSSVVAIEIRRASDEPTAPAFVTIYPPWVRDNWKKDPTPTAEAADARELAEVWMTETAELSAAAATTMIAPRRATPLADYTPKRDPRVETTAREYWTDADRVQLPDYALPVQFKSPDEILASDSLPETLDSDYRRLVDFLYWQSRGARLARHRGQDDDDFRRAQQKRAGIVRMLFEVLQDDSSAAREVWAPATALDPDAARPEWLGMWFQLPDGGAWSDDFQVTVVRQSHDDPNPTSETVRVVSPRDSMTRVRDLIEPLPLRQEYLVDQPGDHTGAGERARIVVRVPVLLPDEVLQELLPAISHWQVWRRLPWEAEAVLVGDYLQPRLTYLDQAEDATLSEPVVVVGPYLFSDQFFVADRRIVMPGVVAGATEIKYHVRPVGVGEEPAAPQRSAAWASVQLFVPPVDPFPVGLSMIWPAASLYLPPTGEPSTDLPRFALAVNFDDPNDADSAGRLTPATIVDATSGATTARLLTPDDFELWCESSPISASGFYAGAEDAAGVQSAGDATTLTSLRAGRSDRPPETRHRKFLVAVEAAAPALFQIAAQMRDEFVSGLSYRFFIRPKASREGSDVREAVGPLRPLAHFLTRALAPIVPSRTEWREPPRVRGVAQVEFIPYEARTAVTERKVETLPLTAGARPLDATLEAKAPQRLRERVGVEWNLGHAVGGGLGPIGGVELLFRDVDDSVVQDRLLCETLDEDVYRVRIPDFRNASAWRLTPREQTARIDFRFAPEPAYPPASRVVEQLLYLDKKSNPLLQELTERGDRFSKSVAPPDKVDQPKPQWLDVLPPVKNFLTAMFAYRKSPLNLGDPELQQVYGQIEFLSLYLFTGLRAPQSPGLADLNVETRRRIETSLETLLLEIEDARFDALPAQDDSDEQRLASQRAFLDLDLAKKLAAVVRRRLAAAREIFVEDGAAIPVAGDDVGANAWLPRGRRFEDLRTQVAQHAGTLGAFELCTRLLNWFPTSDATSPTPILAGNWAATRLSEAIAKLVGLAAYELVAGADPASVARRRAAAAGIVGQASGLTVALNRLKTHLEGQGRRLVKRPHHQVVVSAGADEQKRPEPMRLVDLLPDAARLDAASDQPAADPAATPDAANELPALLNFFERLGFALDVAAVDALGAPIEQDDLARSIDAAQLDLALKNADGVISPHRCFVVLGREPDSEHQGDFPDRRVGPPAYFVGHSFAKLVVLPEDFIALMQSRVWSELTDDEEQRKKVAAALARLSDPPNPAPEARGWLPLRGVTLSGDPQASSNLFRRLAHLLSYFIEPDKAPHAGVRRVRLETRDARWTAVPTIGGRGRIDWTFPDRLGRRMEPPIGRVVSRYEPLVRWAEADHRTPFWPAVQALATLDARRIVDGRVLRLETLSVEERRDLGDVGLDVPEQLPVAVHPHAEHLRFSVTLPAVAARSMYNQISAVRTGYAGYTLAFRYRLRDHDDRDVKGWDRLFAAMQYLPRGEAAERLPDPPAVVDPTPRPLVGEPRLFRHERLVVLDQWPFIYECWLEARSQYNLRYTADPTVSAAGADERRPSLGDSARREPGYLAARPPRIEQVSLAADGASAEWRATILLTRTGELIAPRELAASPPLTPKLITVPEEGAEAQLAFPPDRLPEPAVGYHLSYRVPAAKPTEMSGATPAASADDDVYLFVAELLMPWHSAYRVAPDAATTGLRPWFRGMTSQVEVAAEDSRPQIECGPSATAPAGDFAPAYRVTVKFKTKLSPGDDELLFVDSARRAFQMSRGGLITPPLPLE